MGRSHALAYHRDPAFAIVGLVNRSPVDLPDELKPYPWIDSFEAGLALAPDLVCIASYTDSHADYAVAALEAGAHVFVEKPLAATVADAERVVAAARRQTASSSSATSCGIIRAGSPSSPRRGGSGRPSSCA